LDDQFKAVDKIEADEATGAKSSLVEGGTAPHKPTRPDNAQAVANDTKKTSPNQATQKLRSSMRSMGKMFRKTEEDSQSRSQPQQRVEPSPQESLFATLDEPMQHEDALTLPALETTTKSQMTASSSSPVPLKETEAGLDQAAEKFKSSMKNMGKMFAFR
jgi:hypothetical protein